ncbi:TadE/TadG family type IV pilus assembly protein [Novosphingobium sp.]|uniref:TadE/TadG family type IV pilus assembly protein n=1 Tax=Novosphingobium sp. TaxID=1874826 RepID=UPI00273694D9|nr:TadE/TadG family type IV pilus assembly protein [Novosphingobium sp.]MDP3906618.1 pilus assembly protein [Novosphingobium sp.]
MSHRRPFLDALWRDERGNILPMAASGVLVMAALVGGAVDMSRAYQIQNRLQSACDAGVLAGRRAVTNSGFTDQAKQQAEDYFAINFDEEIHGTQNTSFVPEGDNSGNAITASAATELPMLLMQIFGKQSMELAVSCSSTMGVGNSDVTMVLDVTGSMGTSLSGGGTRLTALQAAMKNFYTTVATATEGSNARIRYAFVPFSTTVNVGQMLMDKDPDYITDQWTIQSRDPVFNTITEQVRTGWQDPILTSETDYSDVTESSSVRYNSTNYTSLSNCNNALPANTTWTNNGAPSTYAGTTINGAGKQIVTTTTEQPQRMRTYYCARSSSRYRAWYYDSNRIFYTHQYATSDPITETRTRTEFARFDYRPVIYDVSLFKTGASVTTRTGSNGTDESSTWDGCIEERQTVSDSTFSFNGLTGMSPADAFDLDIDSAPTADAATKWAPLWREVAYRRSTLAAATSGSKASSSCVPRAQLLQEMEQSPFNAYADSLTAQGNTYLSIGMLWGARLTSPDGIFGDLVKEDPSNGGAVQRHIIFMTDGAQESSSSIYHAYGIESLDRRISDDGSTSQTDARHLSRFRAICDAVKAKGIRIWAIAFTTGLTSDLSYCASGNSAFTASNATQLNAAFQEIAKQVGELRVLQ